MANQYSFIVIGFVIMTFVVIFGWKLIGLKFAVSMAAILLAIMLVFMLSFSTKNQDQLSINSLESTLMSDRPVVLVLYSNY